MATNPYLRQNADAISTNLTTNLNRNILPQFRRGAVASGGWGNSAGGIAQGIAAGDTSRAIADAQGNMFLGAYEGDQNRSNQMGIANLNASTQKSIAEMQNETNRYGLGNQFTLGMGNLGLGWGNLGQQQRQGDQSFALGLGGLGNQSFANDTNRMGTMGGLENQRYGLENQFTLGMGGLENQRYGMDQDYALGLGGLDNQRYATDSSYSLGLGGLQNQAQGQNQNFYSQQRSQDLQAQQQAQQQFLAALQAQMGVGNAQTGIGNQQYDASLNPLKAFGSGLDPFTGLNQSRSETGPQTGGGLAGAAGGALTAAQIWKILNGG